MQCASSSMSTGRRRIEGFSSLTRAMSSMRRTGQPCSGLSGMSGPVARSLLLTATATGPLWWTLLSQQLCPKIGRASGTIAERAM